MSRERNAETQGSASGASANTTVRFDHVERSGRVGAHRLVSRPRRFWMYAVSALAGVALLTGVGIVVVQSLGDGNMTDWLTEVEEEPVPVEPQVAPALDPAAPVVVLNGTSMPGFGAVVDGIITQNQWGQILFSGDAAASDVEISAVFYSAPEDEAAALGLAKELGGVSIYQNDEYAQEYGARLVVLLGADYAGPGSEQFVPAEPEAAEEEVAEEEPAE